MIKKVVDIGGKVYNGGMKAYNIYSFITDMFFHMVKVILLCVGFIAVWWIGAWAHEGDMLRELQANNKFDLLRSNTISSCVITPKEGK